MLQQLAGVDGFWYVATPFTLHPRGHNAAYLDALIAEAWFRNRGFRAYVPIARTHGVSDHIGIPPEDHDFWMSVDTPFMDRAAGLVVVKIPGWDSSKGVAFEIKVFTMQQKPVVYLEWPLCTT